MKVKWRIILRFIQSIICLVDIFGADFSEHRADYNRGDRRGPFAVHHVEGDIYPGRLTVLWVDTVSCGMVSLSCNCIKNKTRKALRSRAHCPLARDHCWTCKASDCAVVLHKTFCTRQRLKFSQGPQFYWDKNIRKWWYRRMRIQCVCLTDQTPVTCTNLSQEYYVARVQGEYTSSLYTGCRLEYVASLNNSSLISAMKQ